MLQENIEDDKDLENCKMNKKHSNSLFSKLVNLRYKYYTFSVKLILPENQRPDIVDGKYDESYDCKPPPITIFLLSLIEVSTFIYYCVKLDDVSITGPTPINSPLIFNPYKKYEIWRYFTYMLLHAGLYHLSFNIVMQLVLGISLELVHKYWRVWLIYISGVVAGSLAASLVDPHTYLLGASAGVYALLYSHMAAIFLNFHEMDYAKTQLIVVLGAILLDSCISVYQSCEAKGPVKTSYIAHFAGGIAGLLMGFTVLCSFHKWDKKGIVRLISINGLLIFLIIMTICNIIL